MRVIKKYFLLQFAIFIYALSVIPSKLASEEVFLSFNSIMLYGILFISLALYAFLWQQVLIKIPLTIAYACKATSIIWSILIGYFIFNEKVCLNNIIGSIIVFIGIVVMIFGGQDNEL